MAAEHVERIGRRIRERREELGLSQGDVARELPGKVDGNQVSRWERGLHRPQDETLEQLGRVLRVDPAYFMSDGPSRSADAPAEQDGSQLDRIERNQLALASRLDAILAALDVGYDPAGDAAEDLVSGALADLGLREAEQPVGDTAEPSDAAVATRRRGLRGTRPA